MDRAVTVLRSKFIAMNVCIKNTERSQINDLMLYLQLLEKKNKRNPNIAEGEKIKVKLNKTETNKTTERINKIKR
jgi:hypothetical protein